MNRRLPTRQASTIAFLLATTASSHAAFVPTLEWSWTSSSVDPSSLNVMGTPSVMDLNRDGKPEVIFGSTASTGGSLVEAGVLRAINGATGSELFTVTDTNYRINAAASVATGDIDGDGKPEIIAVDSSGLRLMAFNSDGTFRWRSQNLEAINWGAPAIADLNKDGKPKIIVGRQVLDNTGALLWTGTGGQGSGGSVGPLSVVSAVDPDGKLNVIAGNTIYNADGTIKARNANLPDGYTAVGKFLAGSSTASIVLVANGQVWLLDQNMTVIWGPVAIPGGGYGGAPTIADFDGDGKPEIGVAGASRYVVINGNGTIKWSTPVQDGSSNRTGSSVFDFENDGSAEVVYGDELFLRVLKGSDGTVLYQTPKSSCTWYEYPLVADVDADGHAEILGVANNNCGFGTQRGVYLWGDPTWVDTRDVWNEHSYHITNVGQDGSIPIGEPVNWLTPGLNNFRLNTYLPGENPAPEPSGLTLLSIGLGALAWMRRRQVTK